MQRVKNSNKINKVVVAIPNNTANLKIKKIFKNKTDVFLGSENDVLDEFYSAANKYKADAIVRICGDCPFVDPNVIDKIVSIFKEKNYDYVSNTIDPTFPDGLDVEIFSFKILKEALLKAKTKYDREHVTPYMMNNNNFKRYNFKYSKNLSKIRLTIDEKKDLKRINFVFNSLKNKKRFGINDIDKLYNKNKNVFRTDGSPDRNEGGYLNSGQNYGKEHIT